jgi:MFS family permease
VPLAPLCVTLAMQAQATMALYSVPAVAPAMARDLGVPGELSGAFVACAYGFGIFSALASPAFVHRFGAVRAIQVVMGCTTMMLLASAAGSVLSLFLATMLLGIGYGAAAPASTHLLAPRTPRLVFNMVMSVRQIGVPLGGVLAALILPPLAVRFGWQAALLMEVPLVLATIVLCEIPRRHWDDVVPSSRPILGRDMLAPFRLLREDRRIRALSAASFVFSGMSLCFVAFTTVQLTTRAGFSLVDAGRMLAIYQIAGTISRPIWGWVADRYLTPAHTLAVHGFGMAASALLAGQIGDGWPGLAIFALAIFAGITAGGYTGVAYAEYAHLGGARRTEATGLGTALMFAGVLVMPPIFAALVALSGGYAVPFAVMAVLTAAGATLLCRS